MRMKLFLAAGAIALGGFVAATAGAARGGIAYAFVGKLTAAPSGGHVSISVEGGTPAALRAMLGHSVEQTFSYGDKTEFLQWAGGVPKVVEADDLDAGDYVRVNVRAPRGSSLDTIEGTPAFLIGDHGTELVKPDKPRLPLPRAGRLGRHREPHADRPRRRPCGRCAADAGPVRRPRPSRSATRRSTCSGRARCPSVISFSDLKAGDRGCDPRPRRRRARRSAQVEATAAAKVAEHEPATAT